MISIKNTSVSADEKQILIDLNIDLSEKKIAIIGANGSGKSTFSRLLNGLILPTQGNVYVDQLDTKKDNKQVRKKVGFIFQNPDHQIVYPIVSEDLAFGLKNLGFSESEIKQKVQIILEKYNLTHLKENYTHQLSGGEKQMLAICGVLVMEPKYIVFDEPTTLLDLKNRNRVIETIKNLSQSIIVVTHDLELLQYFDRVICIDQGQIIIDSTPNTALLQYKQLMK